MHLAASRSRAQPARRQRHASLALAMGSLFAGMCSGLAGCAGPSYEATSPAGSAFSTDSSEHVLARSDKLLIYVAQPQDTFASIAKRFLGSASRDWEIAEANPGSKPRAGYPIVVPLKPASSVGVHSDQYQTIPILCYHRIGMAANKMTVSAAGFAQQLDWLAENGYRVIPLKDMTAFLEGRQALPSRSVVITFDDGYESFYRYAYPLLKKRGFAATVFLYTDFVGAGDALNWEQMREMTASGLVEIQSHSKSHANLTERFRDETDAGYRQRLEAEAKLSREQIERRLKQEVQHYAYPYGDANEAVLDTMANNRYRLGLTVSPGGNPFYAQPLMLKRTMVFGSNDLEAFKAKLQTSRPLPRLPVPAPVQP